MARPQAPLGRPQQLNEDAADTAASAPDKTKDAVTPESVVPTKQVAVYELWQGLHGALLDRTDLEPQLAPGPPSRRST